MKIIILGAGQVGSSVAGSLVNEANDITVVDTDPDCLRTLQDHYDLRTVNGHGSHPAVLRRAGAEDADMLVAVTNSDETNIVACQVAYTLFNTPTKIARVRAPEYLEFRDLFAVDAMPIDYLISPEQLVVEHIVKLIDTPGALQVLDFAGGRVRLVGLKATYGGPFTGQTIGSLGQVLPSIETRVAALYRRERAVDTLPETVIEAGDEVFFVAATEHIQKLLGVVRKQEQTVRRVMIAGGGNIGVHLAGKLEQNYNVKVIEHSVLRAKAIARQLDKAIVLQGDAADEDLLREENIDNTDVFCAVTNDDQVNILAAMLAKRMGARKVMALINRSAYVDLVQSSIIDIAISPQQATIGSLLAHVRRGDVVVVHSLRRGAAESIEAVAHGDRRTSRVVGRSVSEISLPKGATIDAIVRAEEVIIANDQTVIEADDHVIMFMSDKRRVAEVEKLFQVGLTFI
ncbi:MAG: Trk system potassium transporter TrkA [Gammaproteobacteria bacterium]|nr:Trk system potassium transporter TrkA [Gammaproteobacteria bacterium]